MGQGLLIIEVLPSHSVIHTTLGNSPLDEESARRRDFYLTTYKTQKRHHCPPVGFEPAIPASERWQTHALDRAATGIDFIFVLRHLGCQTITVDFKSEEYILALDLDTRFTAGRGNLSRPYCMLQHLISSG